MSVSHFQCKHPVVDVELPPMAKKAKKQKKDSGSTIVLNRSARHEFFVEEKYEAGIALEGWEVKALREGRVNIKDSYVHLKNGEAWLLACTINPLSTASTHITPEPMRSRKLLLNRGELDKLTGLVERKGYTLVPLEIYFKGGWAKVLLGLAKGRRQYDHREAIRAKEERREMRRASDEERGR